MTFNTQIAWKDFFNFTTAILLLNSIAIHRESKKFLLSAL